VAALAWRQLERCRNWSNRTATGTAQLEWPQLERSQLEQLERLRQPGTTGTSNDFIFLGSFGFPWWWGGGYPYGYYGGYPYGYGYGSGYGYGGYPTVTVMALATGMAMAVSMVTVTAMEMAPTNMAATPMEMGTATGAGPELPSYSAGSARAGYYHGSIDGILGPQTREAIRAYEQTAAGLIQFLHCTKRQRERSRKAQRDFIGFEQTPA
jgi:hypothetical protein